MVSERETLNFWSTFKTCGQLTHCLQVEKTRHTVYKYLNQHGCGRNKQSVTETGAILQKLNHDLDVDREVLDCIFSTPFVV